MASAAFDGCFHLTEQSVGLLRLLTIPERHDSGHGTFEWPRRLTGKIEEVPWVRRPPQAQAAARRQTPEARRAVNKFNQSQIQIYPIFWLILLYLWGLFTIVTCTNIITIVTFYLKSESSFETF